MINKTFESDVKDILEHNILPLKQKFEINIADNIFSASTFNNLFLKNRFTYIGKSDDVFFTNNELSDNYFDFYLKIAKSNVGSIFTGGFKFPVEDAIIKKLVNNFDNKKDDIQNFIMKVHEFGVKIFYTLDTAYGRADSKNTALNIFNYSVSFNRNYNNAEYYCRKISDGKCNKIVDLMANQAYYALDYGFDGIMINGDLFGLVGEFTSPETNRRKLGYYNELNDMPKNIINKILTFDKLAKIFYKISLKSLINEVYGTEKTKINTIKNFGDSSSFEKILNFLLMLIKLGVDGFLINFGTFETEFLSNSTHFQRDNIFENIIKKIDEYFKDNKIKNKFGNDVFFIYENCLYNIPNDIAEKDNFLIDFSRQVLADNNVINNLKNKSTFLNCIKCGICDNKISDKCAINCIFRPENMNFYSKTREIFKNYAKNADLKFEKNRGNLSEFDSRIAVIGAGISGINTALFLLEQGYNVDLYEKNNKINMSSRCREIYGYNYLLKQYNDTIESKLLNFVDGNRLKIYLNTEFSKKMLDSTNYSKIIIATGFYTKFLTTPGAVLPNVKSVYEALNNEGYFYGKNKIVIEAKSELSLDLAQYLLLNRKKVILLFPKLDFLVKMNNAKLTYYLYSLKKLGCNVVLMPKICRIESDFAEILIDEKINNQDFRSVILNYKSKKKYKIQERAKNIDLDLYIYEPEIFSNNKLYIDLVSSKYSGEIFVVGNALCPCDYADSIKSAYFVSKNI